MAWISFSVHSTHVNCLFRLFFVDQKAQVDGKSEVEKSSLDQFRIASPCMLYYLQICAISPRKCYAEDGQEFHSRKASLFLDPL